MLGKRIVLVILGIWWTTGVWGQNQGDSLHLATGQSFLKRGNEHPDEDSAIYLYKRGVDYALQNLPNDHPLLGDLYNKLGITYKYRKEFEMASQFYERAIEVRKNHFGPRHSKVGAVYNNLGLLKKEIGDLDQAEFYLKESLEIDRALLGPSHVYIAQTLNNLGLLYRSRGLFDQAITTLQEAVKMKEEVSGPMSNTTSFSYLNLGLAYMEAKKYDQSILSIKKGLAIMENNGNYRGEAAAYENLGNTSFLMGEVDSSLYYYQQGIKRLITNVQQSDLNELKAEDLALNNTSWMVMGGTGRSLLAKYEQTGDIIYLERGITNAKVLLDFIKLTLQNINYSSSKQVFLNRIFHEFERALYICYQAYLHTGDTRYRDQAFEWSEASRSILLLESIRSDQAKFQVGIPSSVQQKEDQLSQELAALKNDLYHAQKTDVGPDSLQELKAQIFDKSLQLQNYLDTISIEYPKYHQLVYKPNHASLAQVQDQLTSPSTGFLEYFTGAEHQFAFYVDQDTIIWHHHQNAVQVKEQVQGLVSQLQDPSSDLNAFKQTAGQVYQQLIEPLSINSEVDQLLVVRDGMLNYLPFEILSQEPSRYLFEDLAISYLHSATIGLQHMNAQGQNWQGRYLAFAPDFNQRKDQSPMANNEVLVRGSLAELPGTFEEVASISKMLNGHFFQGATANEENFKTLSGNFDIIHLATHAIVDQENPMNSRLLFSLSDSLEDGDLYAWELYNMRLNAQMAVLSACNTGIGQLQNGEGVMSLGQAFAYAGCPSIVMSLWPAQDKATAEIMKYFYQGLAQEMSKDQALRQAKLMYLENADDLFIHPFFWAGFVVQGDNRPLARKPHTPLWWILTICGLLALAWILDQKFFNMSLTKAYRSLKT